MPTDVPVVILAGGQSKRFGSDKAEARINGRRLIDHMVDRARTVSGDISIAGPHSYGTALPAVPDRTDGPKGPAAGLWAVLTARPDMQSFLAIPVDMPGLTSDLLHRLAACPPAAVATNGGQPVAAVAHWPAQHLKSLLQTAGREIKGPALQDLARRLDAQHVPASPTELHNINDTDALKTINLAG